MQAQFWHNAWEQGKTGWKQRSANVRLQNHWPQLDLAAGSTVLVPLCGDSVDLLWLREQGYRVVGSELSESAVKHFFDEHLSDCGLSIVKNEGTGHTHYEVEGLSVFCGDFFSLSSTQLGRIDAAYDRAATVAMPEHLRPAYADKMQELVAPGGSVMLIAWEYDQKKMDGPPFSVPPAEVNKLYTTGFDVKTLFSHSGPENLGNLADRGLDTLTETVYQMVRR